MRATALAALLCLASAAAEAQQTARRPDPLFLERSQIFSRLPRDELAFEGQIAPHLFFHRSDPFGAGDVFLRPVVSGAVSFTPMVRLRMFSTTSNPVRTPSYMPRPLLDWQLFRASAVDTTWSERQFATVPIRLWGLTLTPWAHHSNGQDGCLFEHQSRNPASDECEGEPAPGETLRTNKLDGSFSTNFIRVAAGYAYFAPPAATADALEGSDRCTFQLGVEWHPTGYLLGALSGEQAEYYSQWQATASAEIGKGWRGQWTLGSEWRWLSNPAPGVSPWAWSAELTYLPRFLSGWGGFVRYYSGMDYYNLGFMEEIRYLQFGMTWELGASPEFLLPPTVNASDPPPAYSTNRLLDRILPAPLDAACRLVQ